MVLRSLSRLFMPIMVSEMQKKAQQSMNEHYRRQQAQQKKAKSYIVYMWRLDKRSQLLLR